MPQRLACAGCALNLRQYPFCPPPLRAPLPAQTGLPMSGLAVAGAQWRLSGHDRELLQRHYLPWALRAGSRCKDLMCVYYERHLEVREGAWGPKSGAVGAGGGGADIMWLHHLV